MGDPSNLSLSWRTVMITMACLPLVISAVILIFRKIEQPASRYLAALLLACVFTVGPQIIGYAGFYDVWPGLTYFPFYTECWIGPLFYCHAYTLMKGRSIGWRKFLFIPGMAQTAYYVWAFLFLGDYKAKWDYNRNVHEPFVAPVETVFGIGLILFAIAAVLQLVKTYKAYLQQTQSAAFDLNPVWLKRMIIAMMAGTVIYVGLEIFTIFQPVSYDTAFPFQVILIAILAWLSIEAVWRLAEPFPKMIDTETASSEPPRKDWTAEAQKLRVRISSDQWFLEPRLSIRDVASRMGTNETYVSRAINQGMNITFNRLINTMRVEHATECMGHDKAALLSIAFDSGFNSKATFNRVFRDITGQTPSAYKQTIKSQNL